MNTSISTDMVEGLMLRAKQKSRDLPDWIDELSRIFIGIEVRLLEDWLSQNADGLTRAPEWNDLERAVINNSVEMILHNSTGRISGGELQ